MEVYVVGGAVRDLLMGRQPKDYDYVVVGSTPEEMIAQGYKQVGLDFPVFLHPSSGEEFALARTEQKNGVGYHGFDTIFTPDTSLEADLFRRDLTMNAIAHPIDGFDEDGRPYFDFHPDRIIDPFNGASDIEFGYIRHVSMAFKDDPVRVLRAARFAGRYRFAIHPDTMVLMSDMVKAGELQHLPPDRVWKEVSQGLMTGHPVMFFDVLRRCNAMWNLKEYMGGASQSCGLIDANLTDVPLRVRFAVISESFGTDRTLYDNHRIASECRDLAIVLWNCLNEALCYNDYTTRERVHILNRMGGLGSKRNTTLFNDFLQAARLVAPTKRFDTLWHQEFRDLQTDREILLGVDLASVLQNADKTKNMGQIVEDHYVDVLEQFHRKYAN